MDWRAEIVSSAALEAREKQQLHIYTVVVLSGLLYSSSWHLAIWLINIRTHQLFIFSFRQLPFVKTALVETINPNSTSARQEQMMATREEQ